MTDEKKLAVTYTDLTPPRFSLDDPKARVDMLAYLDVNGFAVISNAVPEASLDHLIALFWDYVESVTQGRCHRERPETWSDMYWPTPSSSGIFRLDGVGQSSFMWALRVLPRIRQFYELYYQGTIEFSTSLDGCGTF